MKPVHQVPCHHAAKPVVFGCSLQSPPIFKKQLKPSTPAYLLFAALSEAVPESGDSGAWDPASISIQPSLLLLLVLAQVFDASPQNISPTSVTICHALETESNIKLLSPRARDVNVPGQRLFLPLLFL